MRVHVSLMLQNKAPCVGFHLAAMMKSSEEEDGGQVGGRGSLFLPDCIRFVRKTALTQSAVK